MQRVGIAVMMVLGACLSPCVSRLASAQTDSEPPGALVPIWLARPEYPVIPRSARIQGDVEVAVDVATDGTVVSATMRSGHALFRDAVLEAARETHFIGRRADEPVLPYSLVYTFALESGWKTSSSQPIITGASARLTTVADTGLAIYDYSDIGVRGPTCLYLWRCGREWGGYRANGYERSRSVKCLWLWGCDWSRPQDSSARGR